MLRVTLIALLAASAAGAVEIKEWETLYETGDWRLDVNIWDDDMLSCEARSVSADGTVFSVESWSDGSFSIAIYNENWAFPSEPVPETFVLRIDGADAWDVEAEKYDQSVVSYLDRTDPATQELLTAFYNGTRMDVENTRGRTIASWGLSGSGETMREHARCEDRLGEASAAVEAEPGAKLAKDTF
jgi:hypothetical protein